MVVAFAGLGSLRLDYLEMYERGIAAIFPKDLRIDHAFQIFAFDGGIESIALRVSTMQSTQPASSR